MTWEKPLHDYCIYALLCPDTQKIKYIGQTTNGISRLYGHYRDFKLNKQGRLIKVKAWIKKLKSEGKKFLVQYLDYGTTREELNQKEIYWIKHYRELGVELLNHADGGYVATIKKYTEEEKAEISRRTKEAMARPEIRERYLSAYKNRYFPKTYKPRSDESKKKQANSAYSKLLSTKIIDQDGLVFNSINECAKLLGVSKTAVSRALNQNKLIQGKFLKILEKPKIRICRKNIKTKPIIDNNGVIYKTQQEAAQKLGIDKRTVLRLLKEQRPSRSGIELKYVR